MSQLLGPAFGLGYDGQLDITTNTTDVPIDSTAVGTATTTSLTATNASFAAGQLIMIHQSSGSSPGNWELNRIASYSAGTITTLLPLANTYVTGGNDRAQVLVVKEHTGINVASNTLSSKTGGLGGPGGILALACSGTATITGTIFSQGFSGGVNALGGPRGGTQGQGENGVTGTPSGSANSTGGGGGDNDRGDGGGGGGHVNAGIVGQTGAGGGKGGLQSAVDSADLTTAIFGGGAGAGGNWDDPDRGSGGGPGGGFIYLMARNLVVTGSINVSGSNASNASSGPYYFGAGGGGAGGSLLIKSQTASIGTNLLKSSSGSGGSGTNYGYAGGNGSIGRIRVEACSLTGTTNLGSYSSSVGGFDYCGSLVSIVA